MSEHSHNPEGFPLPLALSSHPRRRPVVSAAVTEFSLLGRAGVERKGGVTQIHQHVCIWVVSLLPNSRTCKVPSLVFSHHARLRMQLETLHNSALKMPQNPTISPLSEHGRSFPGHRKPVLTSQSAHYAPVDLPKDESAHVHQPESVQQCSQSKNHLPEKHLGNIFDHRTD